MGLLTKAGTAGAAARDTQARSTALAVWTLILLSSSLPQILFRELTGNEAPLTIGLLQTAVLAALLALRPALSRLVDYSHVLRWLLAMVVGWNLIIGGVTGTAAWERWQHEVPWVARGAVVQALLVISMLLLAIMVRPSGLDRRQLRLVRGDDARLAERGIYTAGSRPRWRRLGLTWAILITVGTTTAMVFALGSQADDFDVLLWSLPVIGVLAATNTVAEEFGYRNVPLALLPDLIGTRQAVLATGLLFGLAHFYGNPPGLSGVLLATFLGVLIAKSIVETGGSKWAWMIHWVQDVVIFSFLTAAWASL